MTGSWALKSFMVQAVVCRAGNRRGSQDFMVFTLLYLGLYILACFLCVPTLTLYGCGGDFSIKVQERGL